MFKKSSVPGASRISKSNKPKVISANSIFKCQLAHGSPTAMITGFLNVKELYARIAKEFNLKPSQILFCTLNTHKLNMDKILTNRISYEDFIFAHIKGTPKEITFKKEDSIGITIMDNSAGMAIIKRKMENSLASRIETIKIGDHIEKINGIKMVGKKHLEVAEVMKEIPSGAELTLRLIEPLRSDLSMLDSRSKTTGKDFSNIGSGNKTVRFNYNGSVEVQEDEEEDGKEAAAVEKINEVLESYFGISDTTLATQIWELSDGKKSAMELEEAVQYSELENLCLTEELIVEIWGIITNVRTNKEGAIN